MYVMKALIISDKRLGHESQSVALCKLKNFDYEIINVKFKFKILKLFSYVLDFLKIYIPIFMYEKPKNDKFDFIVSAGSTTYYANKFFAKKFKSKNSRLTSKLDELKELEKENSNYIKEIQVLENVEKDDEKLASKYIKEI